MSVARKPSSPYVVHLEKDQKYVDAWRVEAIDKDGGVEIAEFAGPGAQGRAAAYQANQYG